MLPKEFFIDKLQIFNNSFGISSQNTAILRLFNFFNAHHQKTVRIGILYHTLVHLFQPFEDIKKKNKESTFFLEF